MRSINLSRSGTDANSLELCSLSLAFQKCAYASFFLFLGIWSQYTPPRSL